jgi:hypothetical protein
MAGNDPASVGWQPVSRRQVRSIGGGIFKRTAASVDAENRDANALSLDAVPHDRSMHSINREKQTQMSKITTIKRVPAPGYTSGIATGMSMLGPTADGYLHIEFVRDVQMTMEEPINVTDVAGPDGRLYQRVAPAGAGVVQSHKELIATMTIKSNWLATLADGLKALAEKRGVAIDIASTDRPSVDTPSKGTVLGKIAAIKRVTAPNYRSGIATGVTLLGPTADGFLHLEFIRDLQVTLEESVSITKTSGPSGQSYQRTASIGEPVVESRKELLATMSINAALLAWFVVTLKRLAGQHASMPVEQSPAKKPRSRRNIN